jgi:tRNA uridine 5-carbamoylmethylation protein Kti12
MMNKIIFCMGAPGSGKTTWSKRFVKDNSNTVRVGRDDFRYMLKDLPFLPSHLEELITKIQDNTILLALESGYNVIVDNTNLKLKYINHFLKLTNGIAEPEFKVFDVVYSELVVRDNNRDKRVGEKEMKCENFNDMDELKIKIINKFKLGGTIL